MSDTPRMKAAQMAAMEHGTGDVYRVGCDIERELNAANARIKRLEEAGDEMANAYEEITHDSYDQEKIANWRKVMEAKL